MPTYEYQCKHCGKVFDVFQSITARPLRKYRCDDCGDLQPVRRLIGTGGAVLFKGKGFYQTDYRTKSYQEAVKRETETKGGSDAKSKDTPTDGAKKKSPPPEPSSRQTAAAQA